ncbi:uncharacterized protein LODBEIA_P04400 [Lodderomyces beijingensis]|uniref:N-acetylglucosaminylphosphatidylinositol deacetylase n=1 Tax=Lodderomyces beijingensis TaxID=1775926 RepID=A0ABP0ZGE2_9ASCO
MLLNLPRFLLKTYLTSVIVWIMLTTSIPQTITKYTMKPLTSPYFPQSSITVPKRQPILNATVYVVIAHPDDEVMFFAPTILELTKPQYNNQVKLVCFSNGDAGDVAMGPVRTRELYASARILGVEVSNVRVLEYKDGMNETWHSQDIAKSITQVVKEEKEKDKKSGAVIVTFDDGGVSRHANHVALFHGCRKFWQKSRSVRVYTLKSLGFWEKYSFTLLTNVELATDYVTRLIRKFATVNINVSFFSPANDSSSVKIYSDLNKLACSYAAMAYGHYSQMVWFRYGWLMLSRYLTYNHLIEVTR